MRRDRHRPRSYGNRNRSQSAHAHDSRRWSAAHGARGVSSAPAHSGCRPRFRGFPTSAVVVGHRRLPAGCLRDTRGAAGLQQRHRCDRSDLGRPDRGLPRERHRTCAPVYRRRLRRFHAIAGRHGPPLVATSGSPLAVAHGREWPGRNHHDCRAWHRRGQQVRIRGVDGGAYPAAPGARLSRRRRAPRTIDTPPAYRLSPCGQPRARQPDAAPCGDNRRASRPHRSSGSEICPWTQCADRGRS